VVFFLPVSRKTEAKLSSPHQNIKTVNIVMPGYSSRNEKVKQQIVGVLKDTTNTLGDPLFEGGAVDGSNEDHVTMLIADLTKGFNKHLESIKAKKQHCKQEQLETHNKAMLKIPNATKAMSVREFNQKYNCNILDLLQSSRANALSGDFNMSFKKEDAAPTMTAPAGICGKRDRFETPIAPRGSRRAQTPATVRTVRRGEMVL
jgi:hypothetical protein